MTEKKPQDEKSVRLAQALRANLKRRKQAARKAPSPEKADPATPGKDKSDQT